MVQQTEKDKLDITWDLYSEKYKYIHNVNKREYDTVQKSDT